MGKAMSGFLMSLKDVTLAFGGPSVLDGVSISVSRGLRAALTGRNGEGKSTLLKVIAGDLEPDSGEIVRAPGLRTVYVSQEVPADRPGDVAFNALSGGRRRRSILEAALLSRPDLLLLDEPTNHLDMESIDWLEGMLRRARDMAVIVVTHERRLLPAGVRPCPPASLPRARSCRTPPAASGCPGRPPLFCRTMK